MVQEEWDPHSPASARTAPALIADDLPSERAILLTIDDTDSMRRLHAAKKLGDAGAAAAPHAELLARKIGSDRKAAAMLEWMGDAGTDALIGQLGKDSDGLSQRMAMEALFAQEKRGAAALSRAMCLDDAVARRNAVEMLSQMEPGISHLVQHLRHPHSDVRLLSAWGLSRCAGMISQDDANELGGLLRDPESSVMEMAAQALRMHREVGAASLARQYADAEERSDVQELAAEALRSMGDVGARATLALLGQPWNAGVRRRAGALLESMGTTGASALLQGLQSDDAGVRRRAVEAMGRMDACYVARCPHVQELTLLLEDTDSYVRMSTARALKALGVNQPSAEELIAHHSPRAAVTDQWKPGHYL
eukprot:TRINITY_DN8715_c0_g6_i2.p1 TRINITY_DN8715_c0_g6~~TRINITY_DN8715_c0_g6_i2.p1  ORF type:complete len:380 (-),score=72.83 TRINITY_DN8715_c0_g6_i2:92-1186(-)